jgi:hypothetical protein
MTSPPYTGQRVHPNSIEAFRELDIPVRWRAVFEIYVKHHPKNLTDRDVLWYMTGTYLGDMNKVRPRITEMVQDESVPLWEIGDTICQITRAKVRVVGLATIAPQPCHIPEPISSLTEPVEREIRRLYPDARPGQQLELTEIILKPRCPIPDCKFNKE